jgi:cobalt-zinc-cadmium efflux system outer membrane protein
MIFRIFIFIFLFVLLLPATPAPASGQETPAVSLTLEQAIQRVLKQNPELAAYTWDIKAKQGTVEQESRRPNPELELEIENVAGTNETRGLKGAEYTVLVSQALQLAGKRQKRAASANLDKTLSHKELAIKKADLVWHTRKQFLETLYLQEKFKVRRGMKKLAEQFRDKVSIRILAGRTSQAELSRAEVAVHRSQMALDQLKDELDVSRRKLAALWGSTTPGFETVTGHLEPDPSPIPLDTLAKALENNKDMSLLAADIQYRASLLTLEQANRKPDLTVSGGIRRLNDAHSTAFTFSVSLPIPLFDKNRGNIKTAGYLLEKAKAYKKAAKVNLLNRLNVLHGRMTTTLRNAKTLKTIIIPKALETYRVMLKGYSEGKFTYLDVLDAFGTGLEVMEEYQHTVYEYHQLKVDIQRLTEN